LWETKKKKFKKIGRNKKKIWDFFFKKKQIAAVQTVAKSSKILQK
jgi:hypothetical protein